MPIHIFDDQDDNIRVVEPDHASGDADRTYTLSVVGDIDAMNI